MQTSLVPEEPEQTSVTEDPKKNRKRPWTILFSIVLLATLGKWAIIGNETGDYLNSYLITAGAWVICILQSRNHAVS